MVNINVNYGGKKYIYDSHDKSVCVRCTGSKINPDTSQWLTGRVDRLANEGVGLGWVGRARTHARTHAHTHFMNL